MPKFKYVLAIGASAGGLGPCERFFDHAPTNSGFAYVVVQHLSPDFRSLMDELLARHSSMPIYRVENGMKIEADTIYLNRPRQILTVKKGRFIVEADDADDTLRMPIDNFFTSLAADLKHRAVAVVLSGSGSDGTKGAKEIKSKGGRVFAQDPESAKFDSMPMGLIDAGITDGIAEPETLPGLIKEHIAGRLPELAQSANAHDPYWKILSVLHEKFGTDFEDYKPETTRRRLERRLDLTGHQTLDDYYETLLQDPAEIEVIYADLLIEVTSFFRDKEAFEFVETTVIPRICKQMSATHQVRIWVPGCASGEEAYSLAILVAEYAREHGLVFNLKILATDIHERSLSAASAGIYSDEALANVPKARVERYFDKAGAYHQIKASLRRAVVFSPHDLMSDPPFTRMDMVSCRNVLIYLTEEAQRKVMTKFHFSLQKEGVLFLGPSETAGKLINEFDTLSQRWRIYTKRRDVRIFMPSRKLGTPDTMRYSERLNDSKAMTVMTATKGPGKSIVTPRELVIDQALQTLLKIYAPAGFLVNTDGDLVHVFGEGQKFLAFREGAFSQKLTDLLPAPLAKVTNAMLERFRHGVLVEHSRDIECAPDGEPKMYRVSLKHLSSAEDSDSPAEHAIVSIEQTEGLPPVEQAEAQGQLIDEAVVTSYAARVHELELALKSNEETLQATIEEMETSNEELQATNEELMSSNEELQSTNEELHSVNEELYTVSAEHQRKIEELTEITADMDHLLKSTNIGTVFLDENLQVRRFTPAALHAFNLIAQDIGRPISHITARFENVNFAELAAQVRETLKPQDCEIVADDTHYIMRVLPYVDDDQEASGVVITTIDVNELKVAQQQINDMTQFHSEVLRDIGQIVFRWSKDAKKLSYHNAAVAERFGLSPDQLEGASTSDILPDASWQEVEEQLSQVRAGDYVDVRFQQRTRQGSLLHYTGMVRAIAGPTGEVEEFQFTGRDMTDDENYKAVLEDVLEIDRLTVEEIASDNLPSDDAEVRRIRELIALVQEFLGANVVMAAIDPTAAGKAQVPFGFVGKSSKVTPGSYALLETLFPDLDKNTFTQDFYLSDDDASQDAKKLLSELDGTRGILAPIVDKDTVIGRIAFIVADKTDATRKFNNFEVSLTRIAVRWIGHIWERNRRGKELRHTTQELELIFNNVSAKIWYKDDKNRILRLNQAAAKSMGLSVEEATGADSYDLFPEMAKKYHDDDLKVITSGTPMLGIVEEYAPLHGPHGWARTDKIPYTDRETSAKHLLVVSSDVTELMEREHQLVHLNEALDEARGKQQDLYLKTPAMMFSTDAEMIIHDVNLLLAETGGYAREDMLGQPLTAFFEPVPLPETEEDAQEDGDKRAYLFRRMSGDTLEVELASIKAEIASNPEQQQLWVVQDVSARNAALQSLNAQNDELAKLNDGLAQFAYAASHDLQEPLRKISQYGELLQTEHRDNLGEEGQFFVDVMTNSAQRMGGLIKSLLVFSSAAKGELLQSSVDLKTVADRALEDQREEIVKTKAQVSVGALPSLKCDPHLIQLVFANIISNALKYRSRERRLTLSVSAGFNQLKDPTEHRIMFRDNGLGFHDGDSERIFDPFARLVPKSKVPGNGIGLAICRTICDRHGWRIRASGQKDKGSTFVISIPFKLDA